MPDNIPPIWPDAKAIEQPLYNQLLSAFERTLAQEAIPSASQLMANFSAFYLPLSLWIAQQHQDVPLVIGINGSQGSGKSTLCKILTPLLQQGFGKSVTTVSIDDLYKTQRQRQQMSETIHPLFQTRGVPGTHDVSLGISLLSQIKQQTGPVHLPVFDKASDDRKDKKYWPVTDDKTDIILFEGWCVGAIAEDDIDLLHAINALEKNEDKDSHWRQYINQQLKTDYQQLFSYIDKLIMLKIPDFDKVFEWRALQESKLIKQSLVNDKSLAMSENTLKRFIMHFERITRHTQREMPARADLTLELDDDHQINHISIKEFR